MRLSLSVLISMQFPFDFRWSRNENDNSGYVRLTYFVMAVSKPQNWPELQSFLHDQYFIFRNELIVPPKNDLLEGMLPTKRRLDLLGPPCWR